MAFEKMQESDREEINKLEEEKQKFMVESANLRSEFS